MTARVSAILLPVLVLWQSAAPIAAQSIPAADEGVLIVRSAGRVVGREEFALRRVTDARGRNGLTLSAISTYPPADPIRTLVRFAPRRVTVRLATATGEAAREYPTAGRYIIADDSVFALFVLAADGVPGPVRVYLPRSGRRVSGTLEDFGLQPTALGQEIRELRHLVLRIEGRLHHLWYDTAGRLMKVAVPARDVVAERRLR
ncbi:MAG: hypothetical protein IH965_01025 [Gemmatimonadetes bacterium]|nr:hypothetical protein [Gemmatimonadota bacterium]